MSKVGKLAKAIKILKSKPHLINQIIEHDSIYQEQVELKHRMDNGLPVIEYQDIVTATQLPNYLFLDGGSLITDLLLLKSLAIATESCQYFEIGTWRGESCMAVAPSTEKCYTFNLSDEMISELGHDQDYLDQIELLSKPNDQITAIKGDSTSFDFSQLDISPNLVFIDGDHHSAAVRNDSKKIFDWIDPDEATIVWHDYGNSPEKIRWSVLAGILDGIPSSDHKYLYQVGNTKCAIYTRKKYPAAFRPWPHQPKVNFNIEINTESLP